MTIKNVKYESNYDTHSNTDRTIVSLVNSNPGFSIGQVRVVRLEQDASLGNHWREYPEIYGIIGNATICLEDIDTKERENYIIHTGDRLFVPPRVALKILAKKETTIITCAPESNRTDQTHKYNVV